MDRSSMLKDRRSIDYENGVEHFLNTAVIHASDSQSIRCPCRLCGNLKCQPVEEIRNHLFFNGIDQSYLTWIWHGEAATDRALPFVNTKDIPDQEVDTSPLRDAAQAVKMVEAAYNPCTDDPKEFRKLIEDAEKPLFPGCKKYSKLSCLVRLFKFKANNGLPNKGFLELLEIIGDILPDNNEVPPTVYEATKTMTVLGMGYEKIHACPNDCMLYRKEFQDLASCPTCNTSRWKLKKKSNEPRIGVPSKVLWYLPPIPRFQRMFQSPEIAKDLTWYDDQRDPELISKPPRIYSFLEQNHWDSFVKKRNCKEFEATSNVQRESRSANKCNHRLSRKGYAKFQVELKQAEDLVNRAKSISDPSSAPNLGTRTKSKAKKFDRSVMWKKARQNKNGEYDDEEIEKQVAKIDKITRQVEDGSLSIEGANDILTLALGTPEHSGRLRAVGGFVTSSAYFHAPRRGIHSHCEERQQNLEATVSDLQVQVDALKQNLPNTPHSDYAGSNTFKSDNMDSPQLHPSPMVNEVVTDDNMAPFDPITMENRVITEDNMPPSPGPRQKVKKSKQCKLTVGSREHIVAHGTMFERVGPHETIHTVLLGPDNVRVSVDFVIVEDALLPIPIPGEAATIGEALGYQLAWPKKLVLVDYEGNLEIASNKGNLGIAGSKGASKNHEVVGNEATSKNVACEKNLESIRSFASLAKHLLPLKAIKMKVENDLLGVDVQYHLQKVDMGYICELKELSIQCIVLYMSYLYEVMKASNMHRSFLFVNPYVTSVKNKPGDDSDEALLACRLEDAKSGELVFAPCNIGAHWVLLVIEVSTSTVYYLDSINSKVPLNIRILISTAFIIYEGNKGNRRRTLHWKVVQCPKQLKDVECGFYVMMFMRDLIRDQGILSKNNFNGRNTYTKAEIDEVRVEWINFVMTKYEQQFF